jgi:hypothetical protein
MDSRPLLLEALRLPEEKRAALAGELIESLDTDVDLDAEAAWSAEIRARSGPHSFSCRRGSHNLGPGIDRVTEAFYWDSTVSINHVSFSL